MTDTQARRAWGHAPALEFEQKTGLTGLHTPWVMPDGQSHEQVEQAAQDVWEAVMPHVQGRPMDEALDILNTTHKESGETLIAQFDAVVACNPALEALGFARENPFQALMITCGAASQFNLQDLAFAATCSVAENNEANAWAQGIEKRIGVFPEWIVSPATRANIDAQINAHPRYKTGPASASVLHHKK